MNNLVGENETLGLMKPLTAKQRARHGLDRGEKLWFAFYGTRVALISAHTAKTARMRFLADHWPSHYPIARREVKVRRPKPADLAWARDSISSRVGDGRRDREFVAALERAIG